MTDEDRARRRLFYALDELPYDTWLNLELLPAVDVAARLPPDVTG